MCQVTLASNPNRQCGAPVVAGTQRCLIHSVDRQDALQRAIAAGSSVLHLNYSEVDADLVADLVAVGALGRKGEPGRLIELDFTSSVMSADFRDTVFEHHVSFSKCVFHTDVSFEECEFRAIADFRDSLFLGGASFAAARFNAYVTFEFTRFLSVSSFVNAQFRGLADFHAVYFEYEIDFSNCEFERITHFTSVNAEAGMFFSAAAFLGPVSFSDSVVHETAMFRDAHFHDVARFVNTSFERVDYSGMTFEQLCNLDQLSIQSSADFSEARFAEGVFLDGVNFKGETFFSETVVEGPVWISNCLFAEAVVMASVSFQGPFLVSNSEFLATLEFEYVDFGDRLYMGDEVYAERIAFARSTFASLVDLSGVFSGDIIRVESCEWSGPSRLVVGVLPVELDSIDARETLVVDAKVPTDVAELDAGAVSIVRSTLLNSVTFSSSCQVLESSFRFTTGLEQLRFQGDPRWPIDRWGRTVIYDQVAMEFLGVEPRQLEVLYRQLRASLEASRAGPAAADFFYGEMEARRSYTGPFGRSSSSGRRGIKRLISLRWWLLSLYKWFAGYGVRAWRSFMAYSVSVVAVAVALLAFDNALMDPNNSSSDGQPERISSLVDSLAFALKNSVSLFDFPNIGFQAAGTLILVAGRVLGVVFLALGIVGLRSRTER